MVSHSLVKTSFVDSNQIAIKKNKKKVEISFLTGTHGSEKKASWIVLADRSCNMVWSMDRWIDGSAVAMDAWVCDPMCVFRPSWVPAPHAVTAVSSHYHFVG
jgi:hypothetical protein